MQNLYSLSLLLGLTLSIISLTQCGTSESKKTDDRPPQFLLQDRYFACKGKAHITLEYALSKTADFTPSEYNYNQKLIQFHEKTYSFFSYIPNDVGSGNHRSEGSYSFNALDSIITLVQHKFFDWSTNTLGINQNCLGRMDTFQLKMQWDGSLKPLLSPTAFTASKNSKATILLFYGNPNFRERTKAPEEMPPFPEFTEPRLAQSFRCEGVYFF
ncbi:MAG: hypothetical protein AB8F78_19480 [Saprospiraceae bacterium]